MTSRPTLRAILGIALFYGAAGFGGGYSVLAQMRRDLVDKRGWLPGDDFLVLAEISKSLPGSPATSLLALLGQRLGGTRAGILSVCAFLLPSTVMMIACAAAYSILRAATGLAVFFDGMNAAMVGVVGAVTLDLGRTALRGRRDAVVALVCGALLCLRIVSEPVLAFAAVTIGATHGALRKAPAVPLGTKDIVIPPPPPSERLHGGLPWAAALGLGALGTLAGLVRVFVPIGALTFGGGLAMIPAIEHMVVVEQHWIGPRAFADAIALGQITPGPIAVCSTFIGYRVAGLVGSLVATAAMFAPATALALAVGRSVERFRRSPLIEGALRLLAPVVIGMLLAATLSLGRASLDGGVAAILAAVSFVVVARFPVSPLWPLVGGGLVELAARWALHAL